MSRLDRLRRQAERLSQSLAAAAEQSSRRLSAEALEAISPEALSGLDAAELARRYLDAVRATQGR